MKKFELVMDNWSYLHQCKISSIELLGEEVTKVRLVVKVWDVESNIKGLCFLNYCSSKY